MVVPVDPRHVRYVLRARAVETLEYRWLPGGEKNAGDDTKRNSIQ